MREPFGASVDCDQMLEMHRQSIRDRAERLSMYAHIVVLLIEGRDDDRAKAMRDACAAEFAAMNEDFRGLGRARLQQPAERAKQHFQGLDTGEHKVREDHRQERLQQDAEADAAALG